MQRPRPYTTLTATALFAAMASPAAAQPTAVIGPTPIDPTVDAVDPLAASQRVNDPGIARYSPETRVWRQPAGAAWQSGDPAAAGRPYVYRAPGVTAMMARPEHMALTPTGEVLTNAQPFHPDAYVDVIPADTVFSLIPEQDAVAPPPDRMTEDDPRVDGRIDGRFRQGQRRAPVEFLNAQRHGRADLHELRLQFRAAERAEAERAAAAEAEAADAEADEVDADEADADAPATQPTDSAADAEPGADADTSLERLDRLEAALDG